MKLENNKWGLHFIWLQYHTIYTNCACNDFPHHKGKGKVAPMPN
jgi:hypothetical protein